MFWRADTNVMKLIEVVVQNNMCLAIYFCSSESKEWHSKIFLDILYVFNQKCKYINFFLDSILHYLTRSYAKICFPCLLDCLQWRPPLSKLCRLVTICSMKGFTWLKQTDTHYKYFLVEPFSNFLEFGYHFVVIFFRRRTHV